MNMIRRNFDQSSSDDDSDDDSSSMICMVRKPTRSRDLHAWMLDCSSTTHVCIEPELFPKLKKSTAQFTVWTGEKTHGNMSGSVTILAVDRHINAWLEVQLDDVEYSPRGSTNLRSLGRMERTQWIPSFNSPDITPRRLWLDRGYQRLEFVKKGDH